MTSPRSLMPDEPTCPSLAEGSSKADGLSNSSRKLEDEERLSNSPPVKCHTCLQSCNNSFAQIQEGSFFQGECVQKNPLLTPVPPNSSPSEFKVSLLQPSGSHPSNQEKERIDYRTSNPSAADVRKTSQYCSGSAYVVPNGSVSSQPPRQTKSTRYEFHKFGVAEARVSDSASCTLPAIPATKPDVAGTYSLESKPQNDKQHKIAQGMESVSSELLLSPREETSTLAGKKGRVPRSSSKLFRPSSTRSLDPLPVIHSKEKYPFSVERKRVAAVSFFPKKAKKRLPSLIGEEYTSAGSCPNLDSTHTDTLSGRDASAGSIPHQVKSICKKMGGLISEALLHTTAGSSSSSIPSSRKAFRKVGGPQNSHVGRSVYQIEGDKENPVAFGNVCREIPILSLRTTLLESRAEHVPNLPQQHQQQKDQRQKKKENQDRELKEDGQLQLKPLVLEEATRPQQKRKQQQFQKPQQHTLHTKSLSLPQQNTTTCQHPSATLQRDMKKREPQHHENQRQRLQGQHPLQQKEELKDGPQQDVQQQQQKHPQQHHLQQQVRQKLEQEEQRQERYQQHQDKKLQHPQVRQDLQLDLNTSSDSLPCLARLNEEPLCSGENINIFGRKQCISTTLPRSRARWLKEKNKRSINAECLAAVSTEDALSQSVSTLSHEDCRYRVCTVYEIKTNAAAAGRRSKKAGAASLAEVTTRTAAQGALKEASSEESSTRKDRSQLQSKHIGKKKKPLHALITSLTSSLKASNLKRQVSAALLPRAVKRHRKKKEQISFQQSSSLQQQKHESKGKSQLQLFRENGQEQDEENATKRFDSFTLDFFCCGSSSTSSSSVEVECESSSESLEIDSVFNENHPLSDKIGNAADTAACAGNCEDSSKRSQASNGSSCNCEEKIKKREEESTECVCTNGVGRCSSLMSSVHQKAIENKEPLSTLSPSDPLFSSGNVPSVESFPEWPQQQLQQQQRQLTRETSLVNSSVLDRSNNEIHSSRENVLLTGSADTSGTSNRDDGLLHHREKLSKKCAFAADKSCFSIQQLPQQHNHHVEKETASSAFAASDSAVFQVPTRPAAATPAAAGVFLSREFLKSNRISNRRAKSAAAIANQKLVLATAAAATYPGSNLKAIALLETGKSALRADNGKVAAFYLNQATAATDIAENCNLESSSTERHTNYSQTRLLDDKISCANGLCKSKNSSCGQIHQQPQQQEPATPEAAVATEVMREAAKRAAEMATGIGAEVTTLKNMSAARPELESDKAPPAAAAAVSPFPIRANADSEKFIKNAVPGKLLVLDSACRQLENQSSFPCSSPLRTDKTRANLSSPKRFSAVEDYANSSFSSFSTLPSLPSPPPFCLEPEQSLSRRPHKGNSNSTSCSNIVSSSRSSVDIRNHSTCNVLKVYRCSCIDSVSSKRKKTTVITRNRYRRSCSSVGRSSSTGKQRAQKFASLQSRCSSFNSFFTGSSTSRKGSRSGKGRKEMNAQKVKSNNSNDSNDGKHSGCRTKKTPAITATTQFSSKKSTCDVDRNDALSLIKQNNQSKKRCSASLSAGTSVSKRKSYHRIPSKSSSSGKIPNIQTLDTFPSSQQKRHSSVFAGRPASAAATAAVERKAFPEVCWCTAAVGAVVSSFEDNDAFFQQASTNDKNGNHCKVFTSHANAETSETNSSSKARNSSITNSKSSCRGSGRKREISSGNGTGANRCRSKRVSKANHASINMSNSSRMAVCSSTSSCSGTSSDIGSITQRCIDADWREELSKTGNRLGKKTLSKRSQSFVWTSTLKKEKSLQSENSSSGQQRITQQLKQSQHQNSQNHIASVKEGELQVACSRKLRKYQPKQNQHPKSQEQQMDFRQQQNKQQKQLQQQQKAQPQHRHMTLRSNSFSRQQTQNQGREKMQSSLLQEEEKVPLELLQQSKMRREQQHIQMLPMSQNQQLLRRTSPGKGDSFYTEQHHQRRTLEAESTRNHKANSLVLKETAEQASERKIRSTLAKRQISISDFTVVRTIGTGTLGRVLLVFYKNDSKRSSCSSSDRGVDSESNNHIFSAATSPSNWSSSHFTETDDRTLTGSNTTQTLNGFPFALKVMKKRQILSMDQERHVVTERKILHQLNHPFIVNLITSFQDRRHLYLLMEFVNGGELFSLLRNEVFFPEAQARFYAAEILLALEYLHSQSIVFRDLKPENLLLTSKGHIKLVDFGFARFLCNSPAEVSVSTAASALPSNGAPPFFDNSTTTSVAASTAASTNEVALPPATATAATTAACASPTATEALPVVPTQLLQQEQQTEQICCGEAAEEAAVFSAEKVPCFDPFSYDKRTGDFCQTQVVTAAKARPPQPLHAKTAAAATTTTLAAEASTTTAFAETAAETTAASLSDELCTRTGRTHCNTAAEQSTPTFTPKNWRQTLGASSNTCKLRCSGGGDSKRTNNNSSSSSSFSNSSRLPLQQQQRWTKLCTDAGRKLTKTQDFSTVLFTASAEAEEARSCCSHSNSHHSKALSSSSKEKKGNCDFCSKSSEDATKNAEKLGFSLSDKREYADSKDSSTSKSNGNVKEKGSETRFFSVSDEALFSATKLPHRRDRNGRALAEAPAASVRMRSDCSRGKVEDLGEELGKAGVSSDCLRDVALGREAAPTAAAAASIDLREAREKLRLGAEEGESAEWRERKRREHCASAAAAVVNNPSETNVAEAAAKAGNNNEVYVVHPSKSLLLLTPRLFVNASPASPQCFSDFFASPSLAQVSTTAQSAAASADEFYLTFPSSTSAAAAEDSAAAAEEEAAANVVEEERGPTPTLCAASFDLQPSTAGATAFPSAESAAAVDGAAELVGCSSSDSKGSSTKSSSEQSFTSKENSDDSRVVFVSDYFSVEQTRSREIKKSNTDYVAKDSAYRTLRRSTPTRNIISNGLFCSEKDGCQKVPFAALERLGCTVSTPHKSHCCYSAFSSSSFCKAAVAGAASVSSEGGSQKNPTRSKSFSVSTVFTSSDQREKTHKFPVFTRLHSGQQQQAQHHLTSGRQTSENSSEKEHQLTALRSKKKGQRLQPLRAAAEEEEEEEEGRNNTRASSWSSIQLSADSSPAHALLTSLEEAESVAALSTTATPSTRTAQTQQLKEGEKWALRSTPPILQVPKLPSKRQTGITTVAEALERTLESKETTPSISAEAVGVTTTETATATRTTTTSSSPQQSPILQKPNTGEKTASKSKCSNCSKSKASLFLLSPVAMSASRPLRKTPCSAAAGVGCALSAAAVSAVDEAALSEQAKDAEEERRKVEAKTQHYKGVLAAPTERRTSVRRALREQRKRPKTASAASVAAATAITAESKSVKASTDAPHIHSTAESVAAVFEDVSSIPHSNLFSDPTTAEHTAPSHVEVSAAAPAAAAAPAPNKSCGNSSNRSSSRSSSSSSSSRPAVSAGAGVGERLQSAQGICVPVSQLPQRQKGKKQKKGQVQQQKQKQMQRSLKKHQRETVVGPHLQRKPEDQQQQLGKQQPQLKAQDLLFEYGEFSSFSCASLSQAHEHNRSSSCSRRNRNCSIGGDGWHSSEHQSGVNSAGERERSSSKQKSTTSGSNSRRRKGRGIDRRNSNDQRSKESSRKKSQSSACDRSKNTSNSSSDGTFSSSSSVKNSKEARVEMEYGEWPAVFATACTKSQKAAAHSRTTSRNRSNVVSNNNNNNNWSSLHDSTGNNDRNGKTSDKGNQFVPKFPLFSRDNFGNKLKEGTAVGLDALGQCNRCTSVAEKNHSTNENSPHPREVETKTAKTEEKNSSEQSAAATILPSLAEASNRPSTAAATAAGMCRATTAAERCRAKAAAERCRATAAGALGTGASSKSVNNSKDTSQTQEASKLYSLDPFSAKESFRTSEDDRCKDANRTSSGCSIKRKNSNKTCIGNNSCRERYDRVNNRCSSSRTNSVTGNNNKWNRGSNTLCSTVMTQEIASKCCTKRIRNISCSSTSTGKSSTLRAYTMCGTPEYLSPEILLGTGHDFKADCWAFGVLIYEMLTG